MSHPKVVQSVPTIVTRYICAFVLLGTIVASCGPSAGKGAPVGTNQEPSAITVEQALIRLKSMVDSTAKAIAPTFPVEPDNSFQETACQDSAGNTGNTFSAPYSLKFSVPLGTDVSALFVKARDYWSRNGYKVGNDNLATSDPRLHASRDDYQLLLHIPSGGQFGYVDGGTPCLASAAK